VNFCGGASVEHHDRPQVSVVVGAGLVPARVLVEIRAGINPARTTFVVEQRATTVPSAYLDSNLSAVLHSARPDCIR